MNRSTNFNFYLPESTDPIQISDINYNFEQIDGKLKVANNLTTTTEGSVLDARQGKILSEKSVNMESSIAIVANGNTHAAIASGQYVYVKNHGTLSEGLYKATAAIATNGTLSSSNLSAVSGGIANACASKGKISYMTLIDVETISKTETTYTTYQSRKFSDYDICYLFPIIGNYYRQGIVIPRSLFTGSVKNFSIGIWSAGEHVEIALTYVSDTQMKMKYNASGTFSIQVCMGGLVAI